MSITEEIETINNKIEQNKGQHNLDRQTAKVSDLSSGNLSKYELLTGKDVLPEKYLLEKAAELKRFKYSLLGKELKAQTYIAKKQYQKLDDTDEFDETINKKSTIKNYNKLDLIYDTNHSFFKYYRDDKKSHNLSLESKHSFLADFSDDTYKCNDVKPQNKNTKNKKANVYGKISELYNTFLDKYFVVEYDYQKKKEVDRQFGRISETWSTTFFWAYFIKK